MGRFIKGILGGFTGKIGPVIGSNWRGIEYMNSRPKKRTGTPNPFFEGQKARFKLAAIFLKTIGDVVKLSFHKAGSKIIGRNSSLAHLLKNAISGNFPDFSCWNIQKSLWPMEVCPTSENDSKGN